VLDDLRIVIESEWQGIDGAVRWRLPEKLPLVLADSHGLLRAFLNLAQNSHRAVQQGPVRELDIAVSVQERKDPEGRVFRLAKCALSRLPWAANRCSGELHLFQAHFVEGA